jgi:hypothetical protein
MSEGKIQLLSSEELEGSASSAELPAWHSQLWPGGVQSPSKQQPKQETSSQSKAKLQHIQALRIKLYTNTYSLLDSLVCHPWGGFS